MVSEGLQQSLTILIASIGLAAIAYIVLGFINSRFLKNNRYLEPSSLHRIKWTVIAYIIIGGILQAAQRAPSLVALTTRLEQTFFVVSVFIAALILTQVVSAVIRHHVRQSHKHNSTPKILDLVISIIIYTVAIITILQYFQVEITAIIATLGIGGLAIGLALQSTLANLFAGIHLIATEPIRVGDFIEIEFLDLKGYVADIGWRETKIRQINNSLVIVPNNKLAESVIVNDSMPEEQIGCPVEVGVDYTSNLDHVEEVTLRVAKEAQEQIDGALRGWEPKMRFHTFADNNINFTVYLRVEQYIDRLVMTHEFIKRLKAAYDQENIEISWPIRKVYNK